MSDFDRLAIEYDGIHERLINMCARAERAEAERDRLEEALRGLLALTESLASDYGDELWLRRKTRYRNARAALASLEDEP